MIIEDACMLGHRGYHSVRMIRESGSFVEYAKGQAVIGAVKVSVHDQARMVVRNVASKWKPEVLVQTSLAW